MTTTTARPACHDHDPNWWFPEPGDTTTARAAKTICRRCPIRVQCLTDARARGERAGIWGGVDLDQARRTQERQHCQQATCTACGQQWQPTRGKDRRCPPCRTARRNRAAIKRDHALHLHTGGADVATIAATLDVSHHTIRYWIGQHAAGAA